MKTSPLKAMFWKECRENARWAILAGLVLALGIAYAWYHLYQQNYWPSFSNVWSTENLVLTITTPLIGLALGLLQVLPELRRDQWAFLVHRPASRTTLFWGKILPGVSLYLLATSLPFLGLTAWGASPAHVPAVFDWRFTLAGWAAILAGLPFYFAGLLVALRPARWYGSRALPLLTALLAPWAATQLAEFWHVVATIFATIAVLAVAAWGSFVSGGEYREQTKPARFALGLILYPVMLAVGLGALMLLIGAYNLVGGRSASGGDWSRYESKIDTQGRVYSYFEHGPDLAHQDKKTVTITDLAGHAVALPVWENLKQQHKLLDFAYLFQNDPGQDYSRYSDPERYVISLTSFISDARQTYWYYETAAHQAVGYDVTSGVPTRIGYLGPKGFGHSREQAGQFEAARPEPTDFAGFRLLRFPQALYQYDPPAQTVLLLQSLPAVHGGTALLGETSNGYSTEAQALIVAAGDHLTAYGRSAPGGPETPRRLFMLPALFDPKTYSDIQVAMTPDRSRFFFWYEPGPLTQPNRLVIVTSDGRIVKSEIVPAARSAYVAPKMRFVQAAPALVFPPAALSAFALYGYLGHRLGWASAAGVWNTLNDFGPILFFSALGGLLPAVLAYFVSRRLGDGRRGQVAWMLGAFWLGGYGVLLLLALRDWPARVPCPNCGRARVVDNEACEHCGAAWARPKWDGTEIFDDLAERAPAAPRSA